MKPTKKIVSKTKVGLGKKPKKSFPKLDKWLVQKGVLLCNDVQTAKKKSTSPSGSKFSVNRRPSKSPGKDNTEKKVSKSVIQPSTPKKEDKSKGGKSLLDSPPRPVRTNASKTQSAKDVVNKPNKSPGKDNKQIQVSKSLIQLSTPTKEDKSQRPKEAVSTRNKSPGKDNKNIKVSKSLIQPSTPTKEDKSQNPKNVVNRKPKTAPGQDNKKIKVSKSLIQPSTPTKEDNSKGGKSLSDSPRRSSRINAAKFLISKTLSPKADQLNSFKCSSGDGTAKNKTDSKQNTLKNKKNAENKLKKNNRLSMSPQPSKGTSKVKSVNPTKQSTLNNFVVKKVDGKVCNTNDLNVSLEKAGSAHPSGSISLMNRGAKKSPDTGNKKIKNSKTSPKSSNTKENKLSHIKNVSSCSQQNRRANISKSSGFLRQPTSSITKKVNKTTFTRNDSFDSIDLPVFSKTKQKRVTKAKKLKEQKSMFEKYGVVVPTVDEILNDKKDLEMCKSKLRDFNPISEDCLQVPIFEELRRSPIKEQNLDCKHLTNQELEGYFNNNIGFLSDILSGKVKNTRHERYFDQNYKVLTFSVNDLTYNTSTIVFSYEQLRFLVKLLSKHFDPDDTKSQYFFQVLLPELCLKIFTETHDMNEQEAILYLDEKPIED